MDSVGLVLGGGEGVLWVRLPDLTRAEMTAVGMLDGGWQIGQMGQMWFVVEGGAIYIDRYM